MPLKSGARIRETSITPGTGTYTLDGAPVGFQSFSVLGASNLCPYFATDGTNWEEGIGTVLTGPNRLERTTILASSNGGLAVNWGVGTRTLRNGPIGALAVPRGLSKGVAGTGTTVLTQDEQRRSFIEFTGILTGNRVIEVDATVWPAVYHNNTTGAFSLTVKVAGQTGVALPRGRRQMVYCDGVDVRPAAAQLATENGSEFATGTPMLFGQTAAPIGWTKSVTHNDKALRIVSGTVGSGGVSGFTSVFGAGKLAGATTLDTARIPSHLHSQVSTGTNGGGDGVQGGAGVIGSLNTNNTGGGGSHDHTMALDLAYADVIMATRD